MKISATIRRYVFFVLLAGIFVWLLCIIFHPFEQPEPRYQGKNLTDWAEEIDQGAFFARTTDPSHQEQSELAISAIRHIGTNALPVVLKLCRAKDSWFKKHLEGWAERYNFSDWPKQRRFPIYIKSADEKNFEGDNIIWALGSVAKPAIPELIRLLQSRDREIAESAMTALPGIGTNAIPPLLQLLNSGNQEVRLRAAFDLADFFRPKTPATPGGPLVVAGSDSFRSEASAVVPVLLQCLENRKLDQVTLIRAIYSLGLIQEDAPIVVPVIIRHIQSETNNFLMLSDYIATLGNFGTNAKSAVPLLVRILKSKPERPGLITPPKASALVALERIDPATAEPFFEEWKASLTNAPSPNKAATKNESERSGRDN